VAEPLLRIRDRRASRVCAAVCALVLFEAHIGRKAFGRSQAEDPVEQTVAPEPLSGSLAGKLSELARSISASQQMLQQLLAEDDRSGSTAQADRERSVARAALYACILLQLLVIVWLVRKLLASRGQLSNRVHEADRLLQEVQQSAVELERTSDLLTKESARRMRGEAAARLAALSEQSAHRSIEEVLESLDRRIADVIDHVLEDARALRRKDLSTAERRRILDRIGREGESASDALGELVDLRRLHRGELVLERRTIEPAELLARLREWAEPIAEAREHRFELSLQGVLPSPIETDPRRLLRILKLIVGRALESVSTSRIALEVAPELVENTTRLRFSIPCGDPERKPAKDDATGRLEAIAGEGDLVFWVASSIAEDLGGSLVIEREEGGEARYSLRVNCGCELPIRTPLPHSHASGKELLAQTSQRLASALLSGRRILVADDASENLRVIEWVLGRAGAECTLVENGREAVERVLAEQARGKPYDLVLLDLQMPLFDGYQAVGSLRSKGCTTPLVALTASTSSEERRRCLEVGFDDFLTKPIDRNMLLRQLAARFYAGGEDRRASLSRPDGSAPPVPPAPLPAPPADAGKQGITSLFASDEGMTELIEWFTREIEKDIERIERALERGDRGEIGTIVHQLKGSAGSYGFPAVSEQAERVEACIARNDEGEHLQREVAVLIDLCNRLEGS
jgi:CheY-like chemotaxis protein/HPt (histidine-containing phosphotransfer) domain-containing protein